MVNEAILEALKSALTRGESLKKAMMTLYNAGYKKEEISEAAKSINESGFVAQAQQTQPQQVQEPAKKGKKQKKSKQPQPPPQVSAQMLAPGQQLSPQQPAQVQPQQAMQQQVPLSQVPQQQAQQQLIQPQQPGQAPQRVSGYGQPPKQSGKTIIILLGFLLLLLVGILVTIFLFKDELISFFNNLFS